MNTQTSTPNRSELRKFAIIFGCLLSLVFGLAIPYLWKSQANFWIYPIIAGVFFIAWGVVHPVSTIIVYRPWMKLANILGWINTRLIMFLLFYLVFVPIGMLMRLFGKDPMQRHLNQQTSYRVISQAHDKDHMEKPY